MNKDIKRLHNRLVRKLITGKDLEKQMRAINKDFSQDQDFEAIANEKGVTVRELVRDFETLVPELNNY